MSDEVQPAEDTDPNLRADSEDIGLPDIRPALRAVQYDQAGVVSRPIDGFRSTIGIIRWLQSAAVVTLGELEDDLYLDLVLADDTLHQALLESESRALLYRKPLDDDRARELREDLVATHLVPASVRAYQELESKAAEYSVREVLKEEEYNPNDLDPSKQSHIAMRPGYDQLDRDQRHALARFWEGFDTRSGLLEWVRGLTAPTNSQLSEDLASQVIHDETAVAYLLEDDVDERRSQRYREWFLGSIVLPAFAAGVRTLDPGEVIHAEKSGISTYGSQ